MKKLVGIYTVFLLGVLCTGCVSKVHEEVLMESEPASETMSEEEKTDILSPGIEEIDAPIQENSVSIQSFTPEEVEVTPKIVEYDYESACELGEVSQMRGMLPGMGEGTWYTIEIDGVEYFYATYDYFPDKTELFEYAIVSEEYSLANGMSVGMTKSELLECYPNMWIEDTEGNVINSKADWTWWNNTSYPRSPKGTDEEWDYGGEEYYYWDSQFDYIMIADIEQEPDTLPLSVALMMKDDVVAAITFYYPTAN